MTFFITCLHIFLCIMLVAIVLLQHGKGAEVGVVLGGGASQTLFGSRGAGNFLTKLTTAVAVLFMCTSLFLSYYAAPPTATDLIQSAVPAEAPATPQLDEPAPGELGTLEEEPVGNVPSGFEEIPAPAVESEGGGSD